jgi:hypothetical protein
LGGFADYFGDFLGAFALAVVIFGNRQGSLAEV